MAEVTALMFQGSVTKFSWFGLGHQLGFFNSSAMATEGYKQVVAFLWIHGAKSYQSLRKARNSRRRIRFRSGVL